MTMKKYQELENKIKKLQAEVERLKNEEFANKLPEEFTRKEAIRFLENPSFHALDCAFSWESAPQGIEYWAKIADDAFDNKKYKIPTDAVIKKYKIPTDAVIQLQKWVIQSYQQQFGE